MSSTLFLKICENVPRNVSDTVLVSAGHDGLPQLTCELKGLSSKILRFPHSFFSTTKITATCLENNRLSEAISSAPLI